MCENEQRLTARKLLVNTFSWCFTCSLSLVFLSPAAMLQSHFSGSLETWWHSCGPANADDKWMKPFSFPVLWRECSQNTRMQQFRWTFKKFFLFNWFSLFCLVLFLFVCFFFAIHSISDVRPKTTNHRSHKCNYCINTKQHRGVTLQRCEQGETREGGHSTAKGKKRKKNANSHSKTK